ncbi:MAG TPA: hypothetical protein VIF62_10585 [Labilithrix sp.]
MRWRIVFVVATSLGVAAACSGSASTDLFGSSGGPGDSGTGSEGGSSGTSGGGPIDSGGGGDSGGMDAGVSVHELPAPACHDLTQQDPFVVPTANSGPPPAANPATTIAPGVYIATSIIEYEATATLEPAQRITVAVTGSRYYYLYDTAKEHLPVTAEWSIADGTLSRTILCEGPADAGGQVVKNRIDQATDGYIVWAKAQTGNPLAVRYSRAN